MTDRRHDLAPLLSRFLNEHLIRDRGLSQLTRTSYADAFVLLIRFLVKRTKKHADKLCIEDLSVDAVVEYLDDLESVRGNCSRSRNLRLAAIRSFFRYAQMRAPSVLEQAAQIRSINSKRSDHPVIDWLTINEVKAILRLSDSPRREGVRDRAMLSLAYICGLRVSELLRLSLRDLNLGYRPTLHILGKGRRERVLPLGPEMVNLLRAWDRVRPANGYDHVFLNRHGTPMTRDGFAARLKKHATAAAITLPSLSSKRITPHVLRHSCAMHMLKATHDIRKVALWLGHTSIQSTEIYLHADPEEKLEILESHGELGIKAGRFTAGAPDIIRMLSAARKPEAGPAGTMKLRPKDIS